MPSSVLVLDVVDHPVRRPSSVFVFLVETPLLVDKPVVKVVLKVSAAYTVVYSVKVTVYR